jgi:hypothetical protein
VRKATLADAKLLAGWLKRDSGETGDFTGFLANPLNACLIEGDGGAFFVWHGPGIYECHVAFEQRGREVLNLSHRMLQHMRETHGARLFWAAVPIESRHVIMFTRLLGWKSQGVEELSHGYCELFLGE